MSETTNGSVSIHRPTNWPVAVSAGTLAALGYSTILLAYIFLLASNVSVSSSSPWGALGISWVMSLGTVGVPIALWLRYELRWPLAFMGFILIFWHVLAPLIADEGADAPAFAFFLWLAPIYVVVYAVIAYVESGHWRRFLNT